MLERQDVTVSDNAFVIDPHKTLSVSGVDKCSLRYHGNLALWFHHGNRLVTPGRGFVFNFVPFMRRCFFQGYYFLCCLCCSGLIWFDVLEFNLCKNDVFENVMLCILFKFL